MISLFYAQQKYDFVVHNTTNSWFCDVFFLFDFEKEFDEKMNI